jgi:serine/arginine repetitive matrix protein 2
VPDDEELLEEERQTGILAAVATPVKKACARLVSEQLLGRSRPKPIHEDKDELALLINNLHLEATPDMTPLHPSPGLSAKIGEVSTYNLYLVSMLTSVPDSNTS